MSGRMYTVAVIFASFLIIIIALALIAAPHLRPRSAQRTIRLKGQDLHFANDDEIKEAAVYLLSQLRVHD